MRGESKKKFEPRRIVVGVIAIAYIVYMWIKKDILSIYATVSEEHILPMIVITVAVSLLKVASIAGGIFLIKWLIGKIQTRS
jgi:hypothetical protein